jgi:predicted phage-related endonuclease
MSELDTLLTDEFVVFSQKVSEIHIEKKKMKQELKDVYEKINAKMKELDTEAKSLNENFEKWKNSIVKNDEKNK